MANENYHYPSSEEIRIGWEGEVNWSLGYENTYSPIKISLENEDGSMSKVIHDVLSFAIWDGCAEIRCPFLSEKQIVAEGWKILTSKYGNQYYKEREGVIRRDGEYFLNGELVNYNADWVTYDFDKKILTLESFNGDTTYRGKCPDINTFRTICKLVGV